MIEVDFIRRLPALVIVGASSYETPRLVKSVTVALGSHMPRLRVVVSLTGAHAKVDGHNFGLRVHEIGTAILDKARGGLSNPGASRSWRMGDFVLLGSVRGVVEAAPSSADPRVGVRLENGNFRWADAGSLRPLPTSEGRGLQSLLRKNPWKKHNPLSRDEQVLQAVVRAATDGHYEKARKMIDDIRGSYVKGLAYEELWARVPQGHSLRSRSNPGTKVLLSKDEAQEFSNLPVMHGHVISDAASAALNRVTDAPFGHATPPAHDYHEVARWLAPYIRRLEALPPARNERLPFLKKLQKRFAGAK